MESVLLGSILFTDTVICCRVLLRILQTVPYSCGLLRLHFERYPITTTWWMKKWVVLESSRGKESLPCPAFDSWRLAFSRIWWRKVQRLGGSLPGCQQTVCISLAAFSGHFEDAEPLAKQVSHVCCARLPLIRAIPQCCSQRNKLSTLDSVIYRRNGAFWSWQPKLKPQSKQDLFFFLPGNNTFMGR